MAGITEVATKLAGEYNLTVSSAKNLVLAVMDTIHDMAKEERIQVGKHIFKSVTKKERIGRNPKTGEALTIPEKTVIKYKFTGDKVKEEKVAPVEKKTTKKADKKPAKKK